MQKSTTISNLEIHGGLKCTANGNRYKKNVNLASQPPPQLRNNLQHPLAYSKELGADRPTTLFREAAVAMQRLERGEGFVEDLKIALEPGDKKARVAATVGVGEEAQVGAEFDTAIHELADESVEGFVVGSVFLTGGFHLVEERVEEVSRALGHWMDVAFLLIMNPVDALPLRLGRRGLLPTTSNPSRAR